MQYSGFLSLVLIACAGAETVPAPPKTPVRPVTDVIHGVQITDNYRWLEDQNSADTKAWTEAQIAYTRSVLEPLPGRAGLRQLVERLAKVDTSDIPTHRAARYFFTRRTGDQNQSVIYLRENAKDEVLVDPNSMSPDHSTSAQISAVRLDAKVFAYGVRNGGRDEVETLFMDVDSRRLLPDRLPTGRVGNVQLTPDGKGAFYTLMLPAIGCRAFYHPMGSDPKKDKEIFGGNYGPDWFCQVDLSDDGRYLLFTAFQGASAIKSEVYFQDWAKAGPVVPIVRGIDAVFMPVWAGHDLFVMTDWKAPHKRVLKIDPSRPPQQNDWKEIVPEEKSVLTDVAALAGKLVLTYLEDVTSRLRTVSSQGKLIREIQLPSLGTVPWVSGTWESNEVFYGFTSFAFPYTIYRSDLSTGAQNIWFQTNVPIDTAAIDVKQIWYASKDGTRVPMFLIAKKGLLPDGNRPTLLYGYGGFNYSLTPWFNPLYAAWVSNGGLVAVPNLRGGGEFGEAWHKAGMLEKKQNVFDDFLAAAEWLIANKYTKPERLGIYGGSNGGLLVGAAITQRPERFGAAVCAMPLLDMLRYQNFSIAKTWVSEYGSAEDPSQFQTLLKYSPYHQVKSGTQYPAVLFVTGAGDTRVDPLHARKMTALLQASSALKRPVLLRYDTLGGHSGSGGLSQTIDQTTDVLAFLAWQLGLKWDAPTSS